MVLTKKLKLFILWCMEKIITEINIDITKKAAAFLQTAVEEAKAIGIRLFVKHSGCSGKSYGIDVVQKPDPLDLKFESNNLQVFVEPSSYKIFKGLQLDLETQGTNDFLKFNNPNAKHVCGCGESFQVDED